MPWRIRRSIRVDDGSIDPFRLHVQHEELGAAVPREAGRVLDREIRGRRGVRSHHDRPHRWPPSFVVSTLRRRRGHGDGAGMRSSCWCQHTPERGVPARGTAGRPPWTVLTAVGPCAGEANIPPLVTAALDPGGADPRDRGRRPRVPDPGFGRHRSLRPRSRSAGADCRCRSSSRRPVSWSRRASPSNPIGWLLLAAGAGTAIQELAQQYAIYGLLDSPGSVPGADIAAWIPEWIWIPFMASVALLHPAALPGRPPAVAPMGGWRSWAGSRRRSARSASPSRPDRLEGFPGSRTRSASRGRLDPDGRRRRDALLPGRVLGTVASLVVRVRRSRGDERQQLKWLAAVARAPRRVVHVGIPYWTLSGTGGRRSTSSRTSSCSDSPASRSRSAIAILKYRLYDIDVVINKAVVYGILAAFITIVYVAIVVGVGALVGSGGNAVLSAVAAAVIAVAFQPARRRCAAARQPCRVRTPRDAV